MGLGLRLGSESGLALVEGPRSKPMRTVEVDGSILPNLSSDAFTVPASERAVRFRVRVRVRVRFRFRVRVRVKVRVRVSVRARVRVSVRRAWDRIVLTT